MYLGENRKLKKRIKNATNNVKKKKNQKVKSNNISKYLAIFQWTIKPFTR